jgi:hypothetical protein
VRSERIRARMKTRTFWTTKMSGWMDKMIVVCSGESGAIDEMSICGGERQRATVGPEMISNLTLWGGLFLLF